MGINCKLLRVDWFLYLHKTEVIENLFKDNKR